VIHTRGESFAAREGAAAIAVEPGSAVVTIPDAHFLFTADFKRKGPDLVLTGEDGRKILVPDYFRQEKQPDLVSAEGAILSANVVELLAGSATPGQYVQAAAPAAPQPVGRVETVVGSASAVRNGVAIELNVGDLVFQGDVVQTRSNATLAIAFSDGSAFTLNENARMALNEFVYDPNGTGNSALINLVQGTVSFIAAQVAKTGNMRVDTPTATLGIRGTFVTVSVSATDGHTVASLGMETDQATGQQFAGAFTMTNRITGNQVLVNQVNSMFSISPAGMISESPKPPGIHALEQATFQALVPVMAAAANLAQTGPAQGQNLQNPNPNPTQDSPSGQKTGEQGQSSSPGPSPGGSSGPAAPNNQPPADTKPTTVPLTPTSGDPQPPPATPAQTPVPTNTLPVTTTPTQTQTHVTPTGSVTDISYTEAASAQFASFNIFERVSIANAGSPTFFVVGSAQLLSATYVGGLPGALTTPAFLSSLLSVGPDGTVGYDTSKFSFLSAGQSLSYSIAFDVQSGTDTLHLTLTFTVTGTNQAPTISIAAGDAASATITDDVHATTLAAGGTLSFKDVDSADGHSVSVAVKSGPALGSFAAGVIADTTGSDTTSADLAGDVLWVFAANKPHAQSLAAGESETEVFTVTLSDQHGAGASQDVSITVAGVNDAPAFTSGDPHIALTETTTTGSSALQSKSGTLTFTDPDLNDVGYTVSLLGVSASGVIAGLPDAATLLTLLHPTGVTKAAGSSQGVITGTFSAPEQAFDYLWAGETVTLTYTLQLADAHGGTGTQTVTVTATGTNDGPVISGGPVVASVQEDVDAGSSASGQLTVIDPDGSATKTWTVLHAPNYQFKIDEFKIEKNGNLFFRDTFSDGNPPPSAPLGFGNISSYAVTGTFLESGGYVLMNGSNAAYATGSPSGDPFFGEYATLNTNTDPYPTNANLGLKDNSNFTVSGLFDLTLPPGNRNEYGIRLTDRSPSQAGDDVVEVRVTRGTDGIVKVQLVEHDFAAGTHTVRQSFNLNPGSHDKILLTLTHDVIDSQVVHASFQLGTTDESGVHLDAATNFNPLVAPTIFNGENWTRAQFFAEAPALSGTVLQGTYGQLEITQDGAWTYQLANEQANVQALAEGQTVQDHFAVQVADGQGGFDVETITINVSGTNDLPVAAADAASISEDGVPNTVNGNLLTNDTDVDTRGTHTITALKVGEINGTDNGTTITAVGTYGTLVVTKATGFYTYTLANGQSNVQALQHAQQVTDVFTYTNADNHGAVSNPSTLTVTISGLNDAPTIAAGTTATGHMVADTEAAGTPLTELAESYLTAGHNLINGLGGSSGFGETDLAQGDDNSSSAIDITAVFGATGLNFFGQHYTSLYINNNGNITFNAAASQFTPSVITAGANNPIIAPFWADVDTRGGAATATPGGNSTGANRVHYDLDTVNGVMTVTWDDVGYYNSQTNKLNAFQVQLISVGNGDFDIVFRYEDINWTTGSASGGSNGLGGTPARAGYSAGDDNSAHYFELSQSGNQTQILALESTAGNTGIAGVDVFEVRGGNVIPYLGGERHDPVRRRRSR
jgi:VCBS repeat-containing protein